MGLLKITEEEKEKIIKKHREAIIHEKNKREELKKGLQTPK
jgi:hypothetical protein